MTIQTLDIDGKKLVVLTAEAFAELMEKAGVLPPLPPAPAPGHANIDSVPGSGRSAMSHGEPRVPAVSHDESRGPGMSHHAAAPPTHTG